MAIEEIGIRELKAHVSEIVSAVRERRAHYLITWRGRPAAMLVPVDAALPLPDADERLAQEAAEIAAHHGLRGGDTVYAAVARRFATVLVTLD